MSFSVDAEVYAEEVKTTLGLFAVVALLCSVRVRADDAPAVESSNVSIKVGLGALDNVDAITSATVLQAVTSSDSLKRGWRGWYGFTAQYTMKLPSYFAIGVGLGYVSWRGMSSWTVGPRNWLLDCAVLPEVRLKVADRVLLYATVPLGVALDVLNEVESGEEPSNLAFGFLVGGFAGARVLLADRIGVLAELGYIYRSFSHELPVQVLTRSGAPTAEQQDVTVAFGQLALNVGLSVFF